MRTTTAIVSTVLLSAGLLAGCGSSDGDSKSSGNSSGDYCKQLKAAKSDFASFDSSTPNFDKLDNAIATFHKLADDAPPAVDEDWKTLDGALTSMEKALSEAGLKLEDLSAITAGNLPEGMTTEELQSIGPKLQTAFSGLDTDKVKKASDNIEKHAKSECGVDLSD
jgi:hypothetical protein